MDDCTKQMIMDDVTKLLADPREKTPFKRLMSTLLFEYNINSEEFDKFAGLCEAVIGMSSSKPTKWLMEQLMKTRWNSNKQQAITDFTSFAVCTTDFKNILEKSEGDYTLYADDFMAVAQAITNIFEINEIDTYGQVHTLSTIVEQAIFRNPDLATELVGSQVLSDEAINNYLAASLDSRKDEIIESEIQDAAEDAINDLCDMSDVQKKAVAEEMLRQLEGKINA